MINWQIGCSGFYYKHWKKIFYPDKLPQNKWFEYYCEHFNSLELNVTFYRFPELKMVESWYKKSPPGFRFAVKAPRLITHYKQFINTTDLLSEFYSIVEEGLKEKLGCILFQLPPRIKFTEASLAKIITALNDPALKEKNHIPKVLEFRNSTWWNEEVYRRLKENKISFCGQSHPLLPDEAVHNSSLIYYRFHGVPELYKSPYSLEFLTDKINTIRKHKAVKHAFIFFNNDIDGSAILNAGQVKELVNKK